MQVLSAEQIARGFLVIAEVRHPFQRPLMESSVCRTYLNVVSAIHQMLELPLWV